MTLPFSDLSAIDEKGIKLGFNYSIFTGKDMSNAKIRPNLTGGLFFNKRLNNWLVLQPELLFSAKGANYDGEERIKLDNDADGNFDEDPFDLLDNDGDGLTDEDCPEQDFKVSGHYKLYYLDIPILLKVANEYFISNDLNILFGPSLNILLDAKYELGQDGYESLSGELTDLNVVLGIEYFFDSYKFELRVNQSLIQNEFKSAGEVIMESFSEEYFGPSLEDDYQEYCKFQEVNGYNTSILLLLSFLF